VPAPARRHIVRAGRCARPRPASTHIGEAISPRQRVDRLADDVSLSARQLRRRFHDAVGYGPKTLQRNLRLQRFRALNELGLVRAAAEAGDADQAHLTNECRRLTGLTPSELRHN
jgi:transcriptional regulator GlxA family with amidase domain